VDGSSTGIQVPHYGCYSGTANVCLWQILLQKSKF
jgi:hypothetical protein